MSIHRQHVSLSLTAAAAAVASLPMFMSLLEYLWNPTFWRMKPLSLLISSHFILPKWLWNNAELYSVICMCFFICRMITSCFSSICLGIIWEIQICVGKYLRIQQNVCSLCTRAPLQCIMWMCRLALFVVTSRGAQHSGSLCTPFHPLVSLFSYIYKIEKMKCVASFRTRDITTPQQHDMEREHRAMLACWCGVGRWQDNNDSGCSSLSETQQNYVWNPFDSTLLYTYFNVSFGSG